MLSPKSKRNIERILPFGLIWLVCGWVVIVTEISVTRNQNLSPDTDISFTLPVLIFANMANLLVGIIVGILEVLFFEKRFNSFSLAFKTLIKFSIYFSFFILVLILFYPLAYSIETGNSMFDVSAWNKLVKFLSGLSFYTTLFHLSVSLIVSLIYSAISENLGHHIFLNLFTGKYHKPKVERRVFMFLDMKSSTSIAEQIGHHKYFNLLKTYYKMMSDSIVNSHGEIYQYIGDEVVISWKLSKGIEDANCLKCFFDIQDQLHKDQNHLQSNFQCEIKFKAGIHFGEVTVGEIGALKKEIVFTGDVLNTTARIQGMCNELQTDLLISKQLKELIENSNYHFENKGVIELRGKQQKEQLFTVKRKL